MSELFIQPPKSFLHLQLQPNFPDEDLSEQNATILKYMLRESGISTQASSLEKHQYGAFQLAQRVLKITGVSLRYSQDELQAFSHGFATYEVISDVVRPPGRFDITRASANANNTLLGKDLTIEIVPEEGILSKDQLVMLETLRSDLVDLNMAEQFGKWQRQQPEADGVVVALGDHRRESLRQLQARRIGAHIAYELRTSDTAA